MTPRQRQLQTVQIIAGVAAQTTDVFEVATGLGRLQQDRGYEMGLVEDPKEGGKTRQSLVDEDAEDPLGDYLSDQE